MGMNRMTDLVDKIERRLGTKPLNLPDDISKDKWADEFINKDALTTWSRYFPYMIPYLVDMTKKKDGFYLIDEGLADGTEIIGVRDINWHMFSMNSPTLQLGAGYGTYDFLGAAYDVEDAAMNQMMADHTALFSNGIYIDFTPPNKLKLVSTVGGDILRSMKAVPIDLFIKHPKNLMTIEPSKMELFERLAIAYVALDLYEYLKYFDGLETVFANIDLKLSDLQSKAEKLDDVLQEIKEGYVSAGNKNQPVMFTIT